MKTDKNNFSSLKSTLYTCSIILFYLINACSTNNEEPLAASPSFDFTLLNSGKSDNENWNYDLLKLTTEGESATYAQWFPADSVEARGVLIIANPYMGIDWTGEAVDARWRSRSSGSKYPDDEEPSYNSITSSDIVYESIAANAVANDGYISLAKHNNLNVLVVFGRFYAGGSIWNDAQDMRAGLQYISTRTDIDKNKVGLFGISWGAFQAIYATAYRPTELVPAATLAVAPATSMEDLVSHATSIEDITQDIDYAKFYDPYLRRIAASTGGDLNGVGGNFSRFTHNALADNIISPILIMHDEWDTLIPIQHSCDLSLQNGQIETFWYQHVNSDIDYSLPESKLNHGPLGLVVNSSVPSDYTWSMLYLLSHLNSPSDTILLLYDAMAMRVFFQNIHALQLVDKDVSWLLTRLIELTDDRTIMFDGVCTTDCLSGKAYLAAEFNITWGTQLDSDSILNQLSIGIPNANPTPATPLLASCQ